MLFSALCAWGALLLVSIWPLAWDGINRGKSEGDPRTTLWGAVSELSSALRSGEFTLSTLPVDVRENYLGNLRTAFIVLLVGAAAGRLLSWCISRPKLTIRRP